MAVSRAGPDYLRPGILAFPIRRSRTRASPGLQRRRRMAAPTASTDVAPAAVALDRGEDGALVVRLSGTWKLGKTRPDPGPLSRELAGSSPPSRVVFDGEAVAEWDTALLAWLRAAEEACRARKIEIDRAHLPEGVRELLRLAEIVVESPKP